MEVTQRSILLVTQDPVSRGRLNDALKSWGYAVQSVEASNDWIACFRQSPSDLVILDTTCLSQGEPNACARLREWAGPVLPIIFAADDHDDLMIAHALKSGATDFFLSNVSTDLIGHRISCLFRHQEALLEQLQAEGRNAAMLNAVPDPIFEIDIDGVVLDFRAPVKHSLTVGSEAYVGKSIATMLDPESARVCLAAIAEAAQNGTSMRNEFALRRPNFTRWYELSIARKPKERGQKQRFIAVAHDITVRKEAEAHIARLAYFDSLTGLPNRHAFLERVVSELHRVGESGNKLAVLFMDLDGFKNINDTMGHAAGDVILQRVAKRLRHSLRPGDILARTDEASEHGAIDASDSTQTGISTEIARLGGDEFTALIMNIDDPQAAMAIAARISDSMRRPFKLEGRDITLTASIGIAMYPDDGRDGATLLKHADTAMYHAKSTGRNNVQLYSATLTSDLVERVNLENALSEALDRNQFHLLYQPQIDAATGRMTSVEALIRWTHPERGAIPPLKFIPVAEQTGLIEKIGDWVLRTACADAAKWQSQGHAVRVAVNISPVQLQAADIAPRILSILAAAKLDGQWLELEVTEGVLIEHADHARTALSQLRDHGVHITLDDFGTGFSSLTYLTTMPISHIKIDRSFVARLQEGGESAAVVRAVLAMAKGLKLKATAEGVETASQARTLLAMACDNLQGFHFARPMPAADVPTCLRRRWPVTSTEVASNEPVRAIA